MVSELPCSKGYFFTEETGQVKTDLGECNVTVTGLDIKCSKMLVSNPGLYSPWWRYSV